MISKLEPRTDAPAQHTVWGLDVVQLHDRFWASRGAQVVRVGEVCTLQPDAELFLLVDASSLIIFRLGQLVDTLNWLKPMILLLRVHDNRDHGYRERIITDDQDRFIRFEREYGASDTRLVRVAVTGDFDLATRWQHAPDARTGWRNLRHAIAQNQRATASIPGHVYDRDYEPDEQQFIRELVQTWRRPDVTIGRASRLTASVWGDRASKPSPDTRYIGPVWVGAGRKLDAVDSVVGPAVLWDRPDARPEADPLRWDAIEPVDAATVAAAQRVRPRRLSSLQRAGKRAFDIACALVAILITLPFYPLIFLAIWLEDGRPFFFAHRRETLYGREFPCVKFRSMRKDADQIKQELVEANQADGPQFYMEEDPRLTKVGKILRKANIDEWPQFFNVLVGHMSMVGPRPSPYSENQFCPAWREARLSVRPGITGMWQVYRSRKHGLDFQEWIRYDLQYVENMSWGLDMKLIWLTFLEVIKAKRSRSNLPPEENQESA